MVTPVNDFDVTLQAEPKRTLAPRGGLILSATANVVTVAGGVGAPSIITLVATPLVVVGSVVFSTSPTVPITVDPTGLIATLRYADMGSSSVTVTATLTSNGIPYTDSRTISQVTMGSLGYTGALNATANSSTQGALAARPTGTDGDFYFATDALVLYQNVAGAWRAAGNNFTNTSQLIDGAGLGQTASWISVGGRPDDALNLVTKSTFEDGSPGGWATGIVAVTGQSFTKAIQYGSRDLNEGSNVFPMSPGETLYVEGWFDASTSNFDLAFGVAAQKADGTNNWFPGVTLTKGVGWTRVSGSIVVPPGYIKGQPWIQIGAFPPSSFGTARAAGLRISRFQPGATVGATLGVNVNGQATSLSTLSPTIGTYSSSPGGGRTVISDAVIKIYDGSGALRMVMGDLTK